MSTDRVYDNSSRAQAARATRRRIVDAARGMLLADGYHAMSVSQLASTAGVSAQTVYNAIGGKADVVKAVYDVLLVGDDEPVAMQDRPEFRAMSDAPDREAFVRAYAALCATIYERVGPLLGVILAQGAGGDTGLQEFVATIDSERRAGNTNALNALEAAHGLPRGLDRKGFTDPHGAGDLRPVRPPLRVDPRDVRDLAGRGARVRLRPCQRRREVTDAAPDRDQHHRRP
jgi:AcrR family transcriptional regulator